MQYRIISNGIKYKIQFKALWMWWTHQEVINPDHSKDRVFDTLFDAQSFIKTLKARDKQATATWEVVE